MLCTDSDPSHNTSRTISHDSVQPDTLKRYSDVIACLMAFVLRCHSGWESEYSMSLTQEQVDACKLFLDHLKELPAGPRVRDNGRPSDDVDIPDYFEDDSDDEDDPIEDSSMELEALLDIRQVPVTQNPGEERILELLIALYTHLPSKDDTTFYNPLLRFIVLSSRHRTGGWLPPRRITKFFSILLFCGRQVMFSLMQRQVVNGEGIRYTEFLGIAKLFDHQRMPYVYRQFTPTSGTSRHILPAL
jgi:hypothetical protein